MLSRPLINSTSRYLDDLLNIDNPYMEGMVKQIYPPELQLNKANYTDTEAPLLDLHLSIAIGFVSSKILDQLASLSLCSTSVPRSTFARLPLNYGRTYYRFCK